MDEDETVLRDLQAAQLERAVSAIPASAQDVAGSVVRNALSSVPFLGPIAATVIENLPGGRLDRVARMLELVHARLNSVALELDALRNGAAPNSAELLEEALVVASRSRRENRLRRIAAILANGLSAGEGHAVDATRVLRALDRVDDASVDVLAVVVRVGRVGFDFGNDATDREGTEPNRLLLEGSEVKRPDLPPELREWDRRALYMALADLTAAGLLDQGPMTVDADGQVRFYFPSPGGRLLLEMSAEARA